MENVHFQACVKIKWGHVVMNMENETIAAISTPHGKGGIAVIRISGRDALAIGQRVFVPRSGKPLGEIAPRMSVWGDILFDGEVLDDGMAVVFYAPHSYTGEDTVEISCHGGILLTQRVLESVFAAGAQPAPPGEFSKRAFCNGKLALSRAEAVITLIDAENDAQLRVAGGAARGKLTHELEELSSRLRLAISSMYAYIDYPDEDLEDLSVAQLSELLEQVQSSLRQLLQSYRGGRAILQGVRCAIVGKPNTGKSSLLNCLAQESCAIVTDIAGTTRDVVRETVSVGQVTLRLADTAGIRKTSDTVEQLGVMRAMEELEQAELVLAVFDGSRETDDEDAEVLSLLARADCPVICVVNKCDLPQKLNIDFPQNFHVVSISAKQQMGIESLTACVEKLFLDGSIDYGKAAVVANARQYGALTKASDHVARAQKALANGYSQDVAGMDLEEALSALGEVDGSTVSAQIVDEIFHHFCVGK